ncbi:MAG: hypothetical protein QOE66_755 [Chloroflexota bacterium]|jgi:hypothetical protein|nr:hypothetical protein [Chloroflexota bacterium]
MELTFECPICHAVGSVSPVEATPTASCAGCKQPRALRREAFEDGGLRSCAWCGTEDLYLQKDFPQGLGLAIVVLGFAISTVFWYYEMPIPAYLVLLASALLDMVLYYRVPDVTICYRCLGQYRGAGANPGGRFLAFDLAIGERYRQERLRAEQLRSRGASADVPPQ